MLALPAPPPRRRAGLTPMIDVVFLMLVFFMLAARFGVEEALPLTVAGGGAAYDGPPRLVTVLADGVLVNGVVTADPVASLAPLMRDPQDTVAVLPGPGSDVEAIARLLLNLRAAGFSTFALVEGPAP